MTSCVLIRCYEPFTTFKFVVNLVFELGRSVCSQLKQFVVEEQSAFYVNVEINPFHL